jgi:RNA polymerase sigma-70 factor (ECF subfamily)
LKANKITDIELIESIRNGNQYAFTEVVNRYKSTINRTISGMIGKCDEVDDIGQEVFIRFFNSINKFRGESALSTYLTRIAINLSLNEIKRRKLRNLLSIENLLSSGGDIEDKSAGNNNDDKEIINNAIQKLSAKYRSVLVLRLIDSYSTEETAKILNLPAGTVLSRLARAQIKLKEYLEPYFQNHEK